jgi:hypothetical protein
MVRVAAVIRGPERRRYVTNLTYLAMSTVGGLLHETS